MLWRTIPLDVYSGRRVAIHGEVFRATVKLGLPHEVSWFRCFRCQYQSTLHEHGGGDEKILIHVMQNHCSDRDSNPRFEIPITFGLQALADSC